MSESQKKDSLQAEVPKDDKKKEEEVKGKAGKDGKKDAKGNKEEELVSCIELTPVIVRGGPATQGEDGASQRETP